MIGGRELAEVSLEGEMERIVIDFRSKYDRTKTATASIELRIAKMKVEIDLLREK